jgi:Protein of unknown function (DUF2012).
MFLCTVRIHFEIVFVHLRWVSEMSNLQFILIQYCVLVIVYMSSPLSREDGTFTINNVPSGSYVVEVVNPDYAYEPVRVEINSKGKYRARKVNYIQTSQVVQVPYPLKMKPLKRVRYFQVREQWRVTDFLFSPMVSLRCEIILSEKKENSVFCSGAG